jgi:hypothetical protein
LICQGRRSSEKWRIRPAFKYWQKGFISYRHLSGKPGEEGARAKLKYKIGKREISMIETIVKRDGSQKITHKL